MGFAESGIHLPALWTGRIMSLRPADLAAEVVPT